MDDKRIVKLFLERSEQAVEAATKKYGKLCHHLARGIVETDADAAECVNDAFLALWNTIPPEEPRSLRAYLTRLLRNIAYDRRDRQTADKRDSRLELTLQELEEVLPGGTDPEQMLESALIRDVMNGFLRSLPKKDRFVFLRRYYYLDTCREIAKMTGMSESAVSSRLGRLRSKLKELLSKEGIYV